MSADNSKTFPVFQINLSQEAGSFVRCWSGLYRYPGYEMYKSCVTKAELSKKDLRFLFSWKNGPEINSKKEKSILSQILQHDELINELKQKFNERKFEKVFGNMSTLWQIFILHMIQPSEWPLFDKCVYRALNHIQNQEDKRLAPDQGERLKTYNEEYRPFFKELCNLSEGYDLFEVDKALWTFGKVVKEYPGLIRNGLD